MTRAVDDGGLPAGVAAVVAAAGRRLPEAVPQVVAVGLAGSWARAAGRPDSDVDLVVLTTDADALLGSTAWFPALGERPELIRAERFGVVEERRLRLAGGLVVEVAVGSPAWACTQPVDPGTWRVVRDGFRPLYDPRALLHDLVAAVHRDAARGPAGG